MAPSLVEPSLKAGLDWSSEISMQAQRIASRRAKAPESLREIEDEPSSGIRLGPYHLLESLGRGGMGEVFHAYDRANRAEVAVKVPHLHVDRDEARSAFYREFRLATSVVHRNVVRVHAIESVRDLPILVMEYVQGESLTEVVRTEGALCTADALYLITELCSAVEAMHDAEVIHCDLKPDNIAICQEGRVVVMDFGIARRLGEEADASVTGPFCGSPVYMAPEQVTGDAITAATDVYAIGILLYEMLTGRAPWTGTTPHAIALERLFREVPDPRRLVPSIPKSVARVVTDCLAKSPSERYRGVRAIQRTIRGLGLM